MSVSVLGPAVLNHSQYFMRLWLSEENNTNQLRKVNIMVIAKILLIFIIIILLPLIFIIILFVLFLICCIGGLLMAYTYWFFNWFFKKILGEK